MDKNKIFLVGLIGLLMSAGLVLAGCNMEKCPGTGECTVTIAQGAGGLFVDSNSPQSTCGKGRTWNSSTGSYDSGCKVQNNIDNYSGNRTHGRQSCDC